VAGRQNAGTTETALAPPTSGLNIDLAREGAYQLGGKVL